MHLLTIHLHRKRLESHLGAEGLGECYCTHWPIILGGTGSTTLTATIAAGAGGGVALESRDFARAAQ